MNERLDSRSEYTAGHLPPDIYHYLLLRLQLDCLGLRLELLRLVDG